MSEKPIERINYFNGQRLQAGDFRLEQEYHMRVRRWLNRALYTPGIAMGLEVYPVPNAPRVRVSPGLAIDASSRRLYVSHYLNSTATSGLMHVMDLDATGKPTDVTNSPFDICIGLMNVAIARFPL